MVKGSVAPGMSGAAGMAEVGATRGADALFGLHLGAHL
jgi:hypothetical protein